MSIILGSVAIFSFLIAIVATVVAIVEPKQRALAIVVAVCGFAGSIAIVGFVIFAISRMS